MKVWAVKMLFVWRWRLGYWAWDAFRAAWRARPNNPLSTEAKVMRGVAVMFAAIGIAAMVGAAVFARDVWCCSPTPGMRYWGYAIVVQGLCVAGMFGALCVEAWHWDEP